ncbi:hypothetical protein OAR97_05820 [Arcobacteraceae bacterium]|nr:hypothetical protein [Arcobacteraceae bacterium]
MSKQILNTLFEEVKECKENKCVLDKKDIEYIYKPDYGLKDLAIHKQLFGTITPKLCDCIIKKENLILLEIKCGKVTNRILKEIIEQLTNVAKILNTVNLSFDKVIFIYDSLDNAKLRQTIINKNIYGKRLLNIQFKNKAVEI